jgi:murein DD-endopeptidase MepM/ murein hydrolase activator NlpD
MLVAALWGLAGPMACASRSRDGFYYTVKQGENLYRLGLRFGVSPDELIEINRIEDVRSIRVGTRLWIPRRRASTRQAGTAKGGKAAPRKAPRPAETDFAWPLRGKLTSRFGKRHGRGHDGVDLAADRGTPILAAEAGKVIHSGSLGDYGKTVIVKHAGYYRTVYAHARKTCVRNGQFVEKGQKIAEVGSTGRASGPHLHFEIRRGETPEDPLRYLP